jgi:hypothetical protein
MTLAVMHIEKTVLPEANFKHTQQISASQAPLLLAGALVEVCIRGGRILQRNNAHIHSARRLDFFKKNRLHELTVVLYHGALPSSKRNAFGPAQAETQAQCSNLGSGVGGSWIFSHIETWNADCTAGSDAGHHGVEHAGGLLRFGRVCTASASLEANGIHTAVNLRLTEYAPASVHHLIEENGLDARDEVWGGGV